MSLSSDSTTPAAWRRAAGVAAVGGAVGIAGLLLFGPSAMEVPGTAHPVQQPLSSVLGHNLSMPGAAEVRFGVPPEQAGGEPQEDQPVEAPAAADREDATQAPPPPSPPPPPQAAPDPPAPDAPARVAQRPGTILLPHGGTADLVRQEVGADRVLPVPDGIDEATWWGTGLGARSGAAVFAGHVNWQGRRGPFAELWDARVGREVSVMDQDGRAWRFAISEVHTVHKDDLPARAAALFGQDGPHRIVLVTCGGRWQGGALGYEDNRIVVATPIA
ncbi:MULTISPECIES: class F sortase [Actinoalloteichus]|uniref:Sortase family enzyme n=1 Tax=Actinoalloteichus fjordicus TaxID=1612552 RepID=A0AAC9PQ86_9PSEU|nr:MULTISPECIES: class F sortase [Actinoalloteichus]APU12844.1 sortase family enzyme [Actinoalloteichus fjordicus]APU18816.1 sortase family enzyme [Actinoalloteichus sp. GBA129-24]